MAYLECSSSRARERVQASYLAVEKVPRIRQDSFVSTGDFTRKSRRCSDIHTIVDFFWSNRLFRRVSPVEFWVLFRPLGKTPGLSRFLLKRTVYLEHIELNSSNGCDETFSRFSPRPPDNFSSSRRIVDTSTLGTSIRHMCCPHTYPRHV